MLAIIYNPIIMNDFEFDFITEQKLNFNYFFDAKGLPLTQSLKDEMKLNDKIFAFNTAQCDNGHTLKSRSGHCIVCDTKNIHFTLLNYKEGYIYIAGSLSSKKIKIGATSNIEKREKYLNENKGYGNINDWKILYHVFTPKMGKHEIIIHNRLIKYNEAPIKYFRNNEFILAKEIYRCSYEKAYNIIKLHFKEFKVNYKRIEHNLEKYQFPNLPK